MLPKMIFLCDLNLFLLINWLKLALRNNVRNFFCVKHFGKALSEWFVCLEGSILMAWGGSLTFWFARWNLWTLSASRHFRITMVYQLHWTWPPSICTRNQRQNFHLQSMRFHLTKIISQNRVKQLVPQLIVVAQLLAMSSKQQIEMIGRQSILVFSHNSLVKPI